MTILQQRVKEAIQARRRLPDDLGNLGGLNRLHGFLRAFEGEVLILGDRPHGQPWNWTRW